MNKIKFISLVIILNGLFLFGVILFFINTLHSPVFVQTYDIKKLSQNSAVMQAYNDCFTAQKNATDVQLQECKLSAKNIWTATDIRQSRCELEQAKSIELACNSIIRDYAISH